MKKTTSTSTSISIFIGLILALTIASAPSTTLASTRSNSNEAQIQILMELLATLQTMLAELIAQNDSYEDGEDSAAERNVRVTYPNDNKQFIADKGAFIARWDSDDEKVDVYLLTSDSVRRQTIGKNIRNTTQSREVIIDTALLGKDVNRFKLEVCVAGTNICDQSDEWFTFTWLVSEPLQNLHISSITLSHPNGIGHTASPGAYMLQQKVGVNIKNNQYGTKFHSGEKLDYSAELYEVEDDGSLDRTGIKVTGESYVPYANGYSSFEFLIDGGLTFEGDDYERHYKIKVKIDTANDVKESNERDNTAWSDEWMMDYYKG